MTVQNLSSKEPIRVMHVLHALDYGGVPRMVVDMLRYHERSKFEPFCVVLQRCAQTPYDVELRDANIQVFSLEKGEKFSLKSVYKILKIMRKLSPQVVHTHSRGLNYAIIATALFRPSACIHTIHGEVLYERGTGKNRLIRHFALDKKWKGYYVPVVIASVHLQTAREIYHREDVYCIPNGIEVHDFQPREECRYQMRYQLKIPSDSIVITSVSRLHPAKRVDLIVKAFSIIAHKKRSVYLLIVGSGEEMHRIKEEIKKMSLCDRVYLLGERKDIPAILSASDIFAISSKHEGFGLAIVEAMAASLPVVATRVGGIPEVVVDGETGFLVDSDRPEELALALERLIEDPSLRYRMGQAGLRRAHLTYDVRQMVRNYEDLYTKLIEVHKK